MIKVFAALVGSLLFSSLSSGGQHQFRMSLDDRFVVADSEKWSVAVERQLSLRFADVKITPKQGHGFSLMLYFKCDTPDLAEFDTPEKMKEAVRSSSEKYLSGTVEKAVELKELNAKGWYGFYTTLTDKEVAEKKKIPDGEFKYLMRGMIRLTPDSALGFSLMTNELGTPEYKELMSFILGFAKQKE